MPFKTLTPDRKRIVAGIGLAALVFFGTAATQYIDPPPTGAGLAPLAPDIRPGERLYAGSAAALEAAFARDGYTMDAVRNGEAVPRTMLPALPGWLDDDTGAERRKRLFLKAALPLVLRVNETIRAQRATLERLLRRREGGETLGGRERAWLARIAAHYRTDPDNAAELRARVRPVPPSLALAQAATESGWGSSRFAQAGNALFGQWTYSEDKGLEPEKREPGKTHRVKAYDRLIESVWDYARNLNTNRAYLGFREMRARLAADGGRPAGLLLAATLSSYSQKGMEYVWLIQDVIRQNGLDRLDGAALAPRETRLAAR
jgi:Bax protein